MPKLSSSIFSSPRGSRATPKGSAGYDNARENIDPHIRTLSLRTLLLVFL